MEKLKNPIYVAQPSLPELTEFVPYLQKIWESKILTNNGQYHQQFEKELARFLDVPYISLFTNGTLALVSALQVLGVSGEVITTPYSFVATSHSLLWNKLKPVFVDVDPDYCNLDPEKIEAAITPETTAIMPVHVYGNPCNIERIKEIADMYGLKVIYDAAHAFGVEYQGQSICNYGDISVLSFHATKVYNTMEGGAIICHDAAVKKRTDYLKNFGFAGETKVVSLGINSKMNEMQAALGLLQLKYFKQNVEKRKILDQAYKNKIDEIDGISCLPNPANTVSNFAYFPIFVDEKKYGLSRDQLYEKLKEHGVFGRRYFYPLISSFPMYRGLESANAKNLKNAREASQKVICLPIFPEMKMKQVDFIVDCLQEFSGTSKVSKTRLRLA